MTQCSRQSCCTGTRYWYSLSLTCLSSPGHSLQANEQVSQSGSNKYRRRLFMVSFLTYLKYLVQTRFAAFTRKRRAWQATTPYSESVEHLIRHLAVHLVSIKLVSIKSNCVGLYRACIFSVKFAWYYVYVFLFNTVILAQEVNCWCDDRIAEGRKMTMDRFLQKCTRTEVLTRLVAEDFGCTETGRTSKCWTYHW